MSATIVEFPASNLSDMPTLLRTIADQIEAGEHGEPTAGVLVIEAPMSEWPAVFGLGSDAIPPRCVWLLELAKAFFVTNHTERP